MANITASQGLSPDPERGSSGFDSPYPNCLFPLVPYVHTTSLYLLPLICEQCLIDRKPKTRQSDMV